MNHETTARRACEANERLRGRRMRQDVEDASHLADDPKSPYSHTENDVFWGLWPRKADGPGILGHETPPEELGGTPGSIEDDHY